MSSRRQFLQSGLTIVGGSLSAIYLAHEPLSTSSPAPKAGAARSANTYPAQNVVNAADFGAIGDGDPQRADRNTSAIQAALDTGASVYLGSKDQIFPISAGLRMERGQRIFADGATLRASRRMSWLLIPADDFTVEGIVFDSSNTQPPRGVPITNTGSAYGIHIENVHGCHIRRCRFTRYKRGISITSTALGRRCGNHLIEDCEAIAGYDWPSSRSSNEQHGAYVGSQARPEARTIAEYPARAGDCEDVHDIRFVNWRVHEGQYGLALHRCSDVIVTGGTFTGMSRGISVQHQSCRISISGALFEQLDSAGVHIARGSSYVMVSRNRFRGTMANDNVGVQAYYGVHGVTLENNDFDSGFSEWSGGRSAEARSPGAAIRLGQQAEDIVVRNNIIRGYRWGILLNSTIYPNRITPSDGDYFYTGIRNVSVLNNQIEGAYYGTARGNRQAHSMDDSIGIEVSLNAAWEDAARGGWDLEEIVVRENSVSNVGNAYVVTSVRVRNARRAVGITRNGIVLDANRVSHARNNFVMRGISNASAVAQSNNGWSAAR